MANQQVQLLGLWLSPFTQRVIWALKLKGISYEYIEEDISNKSELLLKLNPCHKKVPVLVHAGKPIAESMIILQYIDDLWPETHPLLPTDAYERSFVRFWAKFIDEKVTDMWEFFKTSGDEQEKAIRYTNDMLRIIEEHGLDDERKFFGGEKVGLADLALGWIVHTLTAMEEIVGLQFIKVHTFPRLHSWKEKFMANSLIRDTLPDSKRVFSTFKLKREMFFSLPHHSST
ncbi:unnamed protein product [Rhodiola kirilowii]